MYSHYQKIKSFIYYSQQDMKENFPQDLKKILSSNPKLCQTFLDIQKELGIDSEPDLEKQSVFIFTLI